MSFKVTRLTLGKGKTAGDEKAGEWNRQYFEVEAVIQDESQLELAKNSLEALLDIWLKGESVSPSEDKPSWDPAKIKWKPAEGTSGPYERSEDVNNPEFKALVKDLAAHNGRLTREGYFYWTFKNGATVGRKQRGKAKTKQAAVPQKLSEIFPEDLRNLLSFEETAEAFIIKPRQFLGSENFAKIAAIVRDHKGEYVSREKKSHFRIPKAAK